MTELRLGLVSRTFYYVPVWAAVDQGFFADEGFDVTLDFIGGAEQNLGLLGGTLDLSIAPPDGILQNAQQGGPLRVIAGNSGQLSHWLMVRPGIASIEDLRGRVFGMLNRREGSLYHFIELAERHGLHFPGDYEVVETGGAPARHHALLRGEIDAGLQSVPWCFLGEEMGLRKLADISDYVPDWQFNTVNASVDWCRADGARATAALRALLRGVEWTYANREAASLLAARHMEIDPAYTRRAWDYFSSLGKLERDMSINEAGLLKVIDALVRGGMLSAAGATDLSRSVDTTWIDRARAGLALETP